MSESIQIKLTPQDLQQGRVDFNVFLNVRLACRADDVFLEKVQYTDNAFPVHLIQVVQVEVDKPITPFIFFESFENAFTIPLQFGVKHVVVVPDDDWIDV